MSSGIQVSVGVYILACIAWVMMGLSITVILFITLVWGLLFLVLLILHKGSGTTERKGKMIYLPNEIVKPRLPERGTRGIIQAIGLLFLVLMLTYAAVVVFYGR